MGNERTGGQPLKIVFENKSIFKEFEIKEDIDRFSFGTELGNNVRLQKDRFFENFSLEFYKVSGTWNVRASDNVYLSLGSPKKIRGKDLVIGEVVGIRYANTNTEFFSFYLDYNFDFSDFDYDREISIKDTETINIGNSADSQIRIGSFRPGDSVSLRRAGDGYEIGADRSEYGVLVNGNKTEGGKTEIGDGDFFSVGNFSFLITGGKIRTSARDSIEVFGLPEDISGQSRSVLAYPHFNRSSRIKPVIPEETLKILEPPAKPEKQRSNILMSLIPMLGMVAMMLVMSNMMGGSGGGSYMIMSMGMMGVGVIGSVAAAIFQKKEFKKKVRERKEKYTNYIDRKREEFQQVRDHEKAILLDIYMPMEKNIEAVRDFTNVLFDRHVNDDDFLGTYLGTGTRNALRLIEYKKKESLEPEDEISLLPEELANEFRKIEGAPVYIGLRDKNAIGIVGDFNHVYEIIKNTVTDLVVRHYYEDLKLFVIFEEKHKDKFEWLKWFPHVKNERLNNRNIAYDDDSKTGLYEYLYKELSDRDEAKGKFPAFVVLILDSGEFKRHPVSRFLPKARELGAVFIFVESNMILLPQYCDEVIVANDGGKAKMARSEDRNDTQPFDYERIEDKAINWIGKRLAPVYCDEISLESSLTKSISLFELLDIFSVSDIDIKTNWENSKVYKSMSAPLGIKTKNEIVSLDLHEKAHGPHGLVAGTTGSGKSEILQSYILSAATLFHPYDISFVIIDFKGGGMASQFTDLPHLVGAITNIDGKEINRSLLSIKAELLKRQNLFSESGVNKIDDYIKKYKNGEVAVPLPHLVIIVDEFAELKADQPEFMAELISAARIGRSLGVHLILATQKPSGQVSEQIWSNSRFKLCLKVQTPEDSNEMLKSPLAAEILEPGRAYFQVGNNEIFELFQSAYSGSPEKLDESGKAEKSFYIASVDLAGRRKVLYEQKPQKSEEKQRTQLEAIVSCVNEYCHQNDIVKLPNICLPPLPEVLDFADAGAGAGEFLDIPIGIYDDPSNQYQGKADLKIGSSNVMIAGSSQTGKTNLLQTIIRSLAGRYSPDEVNIYIIDFASMVLKIFESLAHVGGIVTTAEDEKLKNLFKLLNEEVAIRKEKLVTAGVSSFSAYKEAGFSDIPQIVLLIDNLTMLKELYFSDDDPLLALSRDSVSVGISIVIANSGTQGIGYRYLANFGGRVALFSNDSGDYGALFDHCRMEPSETPGRCLVQINKQIYECQTYLSFQGEKEIERTANMREFIGEMNERYGSAAKLIPEIPQILTEEILSANFNIVEKPFRLNFGLDYETVEPFYIDFLRNLMLGLIDNENASGKSFKRYLIDKLLSDNGENIYVYIVDDIEKSFSELKGHENVHYTVSLESVKDMITAINGELAGRYQKLLTDSESSDNRQMLLVIGNNDACQIINDDMDVKDQYAEICSRYKDLGVSVIFTSIPNQAISYSAPDPLRYLKEQGNFLFFGNIGEYKVSDISIMDVRKHKKAIVAGDAFYIRENDIRKLKVVSA
jgi:S-DNA-T family DNA segregation ATPase FtsK/SpoIIIE